MNIPNSGLCDLLQKSHPVTMECLMNGYRLVTTKWPAAWKKLYDLADRIHFGDESFDFLPYVTKNLATYLKVTTPNSVISTYPLYGQIIEKLFGQEKLPFNFVTMVTDSKSINKSWLHKAQGDFAVLDKASANFFLKHAPPALSRGLLSSPMIRSRSVRLWVRNPLSSHNLLVFLVVSHE